MVKFIDMINHYRSKLYICFTNLEVVSRYRDPQLQLHKKTYLSFYNLNQSVLV